MKVTHRFVKTTAVRKQDFVLKQKSYRVPDYTQHKETPPQIVLNDVAQGNHKPRKESQEIFSDVEDQL